MAIRIVNGTTVATLASVINEHDSSIVALQGEVALLPTDAEVDAKIAAAGTGTGVALGETSNTAYRGDRGKIAYDYSQGEVPLVNRPVLGLAAYLKNTGTEEDPILSIDFTNAVFIAEIQNIAGGSAPLPTPVAPTVLFNSTNRTLSATHSTYPNGMEYSSNSGSTWANYTAGANISVGNGVVSANVYQWRVKAVAGVNNVGVVAGNTAISAASTGGATQLIFAGKDASIVVDSGTNTYSNTDTGGAPWNRRIFNTGKKLVADGGLFIDSANDGVIGLNAVDAATYYSNIRVAMRDTGTEIFRIDSVNGNTYVQAKEPGYKYGIFRDANNIVSILKSQDSFATPGVALASGGSFPDPITGTLYAIGDMNNGASNIVNPRGINFVAV